MLLDQDRSCEAQQRLGVGEHADDVGAALDLLVDPFEGVGGPDLAPVGLRGRRERQQVVLRLAEHRLDLGQLPAEHASDDIELLLDVLGIRLGEDRADRRGDHLGVALRHDRQDVAHEMHAASLPTGADQDRCDGLLQNRYGRRR